MTIPDLLRDDECQAVTGLSVPSFRHRDHRWQLVLVRWAQVQKHLPTPCRMVILDAHHDALPPRRYDELRGFSPYDLSVETIASHCRNVLSRLDNDWITAGMELGLLSDVVIFGVEDTSRADELSLFVDSRDTPHRLHILPSLPGSSLGEQGLLSDTARRDQLTELWNTLDWDPPNGFVTNRTPCALDFDLDCFVVRWRGYQLPWPDEVWEHEFRTASDHWPTRGWTGASWLNALRASAGLITFAMEPDHCGGDGKSESALIQLSRYLLDGAITTGAVPDPSEDRPGSASRP